MTMQHFVLPWQRPGLLGIVLGGRPLLPTPMEHLQATSLARKQLNPEVKSRGGGAADDSEENDASDKRVRAEVVLKAKAAPRRR